MNPVIVIPTYVGPKRHVPSDEVIGTYDHMTPLTHLGELPRCLGSLKDQGIEVPVVLLVVPEAGISQQAGEKIMGVARTFADALSIQVVDSQTVERLHDRMAELGAESMIEGVGLRGYGAIRNLGLLVATVRGFTEVVFIDDDEIVDYPDFMERATYGLGRLSPKGVPILVKSGYCNIAKDQWRSSQSNAWYNRFWGQGELFNKWMAGAMSASRISTSNILNGGCMAIHREAFIRISFDAWISRGEDLDYLLNVLMYGGKVWFDNQWCIQHRPPLERSEGQRFRQDIYRWIYEHRKLEFAKSQIDLLQIQPESLDPYPGTFLNRSVGRRAFLTACLRTIGRPRDRQGYLKAALAVPRDARDYALSFCSRYFEFQRIWPSFVTNSMQDLITQQILRSGVAEPLQKEDPI
ncbi:MAG: hypothetical protein FWF71_05560 [Actinomycetia bacterium]|nr:hypothetical protein [Actinomycetes bacterium]